MTPKNIITHNFEETQKEGYEFAQKLRGGEVLALYGDLGSGKTTFVQGLAKGLGIKKRLISPTFIIMRSYQISFPIVSSPSMGEDEGEGENFSTLPPRRDRSKNKSSQLQNFYHVDLYRINTVQDIEGLGLMEFMGNPDNIVAIEWPEKMKNTLPENRWELFFEYIDDNKRKINIEKL